MFASAIHSTDVDPAKQIALAFFEGLAAESKRWEFSVKFWDGTELQLAPVSRFTMVLRHPRVVRNLFDSPNELTLGEAFVRGDLDVEGDLGEALQFAEMLMSYKPTLMQKAQLGMLTAAMPGANLFKRNHKDGFKGAVHSRERDRIAISHHYDVSNDFYELWLDHGMVYSAAYFNTPDEDLDTAQVRKLDSICRKLRLRVGDRFLDIGCGWGALAIHAAKHYGANVCGITLSVRQAELAERRIRSANLEDRCKVRICDYRDLEETEAYDKIASIGMAEHVGESMLGQYFRQAWRLLRRGGVFLNSAIAASATYQRQGASFIDEYVFPDGELVPLHTTLREAELSGFEVREVEGHREHYALTLDRWVQRLEEHADQARRATNDATYRIWRLYMTASARAFRIGRINLYQVLLSKPD